MTASQRRRTGDGSPRGERRRQILVQARLLFHARGYRATTLEDVAGAAGLTPGVVRRSFPTTQALLVEILAEVRAATLDRWQAEADGDTDPQARLHHLAGTYLEAVETLSLEHRILHRALLEAEEEVRAALRDYYQECEDFLAALIAEGQQSGVFRRSLDPRVGAWELLRVGVAHTLLAPLALPVAAEDGARMRTVECLLRCLEKTDV